MATRPTLCEMKDKAKLYCQQGTGMKDVIKKTRAMLKKEKMLKLYPKIYKGVIGPFFKGKGIKLAGQGINLSGQGISPAGRGLKGYRSKWNLHMSKVRKENPDKTFGQCAKIAKASYKKKK
jgi:hypothetical protein